MGGSTPGAPGPAGSSSSAAFFATVRAAFPPFFAAALVARLSAEFCIPLTENTSRAQLLAGHAEAELRAARRADSQQATTRALSHFPLIAARG